MDARHCGQGRGAAFGGLRHQRVGHDGGTVARDAGIFPEKQQEMPFVRTFCRAGLPVWRNQKPAGGFRGWRRAGHQRGHEEEGAHRPVQERRQDMAQGG